MNSVGEKSLYPYVLDHKPGFFLSWFLYRLFKRVRFDENMKEDLKLMHRAGTVVYAIKYRGQLDYLLYHYNFRSRRVPYPKIAFDLNIFMLLPFTHFVKIILSQLSYLFTHGHLPNPYQTGFYKEAIQKGTTFLMFLVDPKGFLRHFIHAEKDQLQFLLETQREMVRPIFIVPQLILYKKTPEKDYSSLTNILFGYKDHPGVIRKIVLFFRHNRQAFIDFGRPFDLKAYLETQPPERPLHDMTVEIREMLIESIDSQKRVIIGPIMKSRQQLKETVLMDQRIREKIEKMAGDEGKKLKQIRKKAGEYFDEIAADYNIAYIQAFRVALKWFWKKIFEGIDVDMESLAKVREWARKGTLIYVPSHKSHIDYLVLNYLLHDYHMHTPRIAAGKNLGFWPMGHIFRKCGAFFIRRTFKNAKLYKEVFTRYIKILLEEGHPIEFFIEGGRSRNGKLVFPKLGFLSILLQAHKQGFCKDLIFIPTSIVYDRILEERSYLKELDGKVKEQESLKQVIRARRFLKTRYGKIYIKFNEPLSLNEYLARKDRRGQETLQHLAFRLVQSINDVTPVTPLALIATAILANHRRGFLLSELVETVDILLRFLIRQGAPLATTLTDPSKAVEETLALLIDWKMVESLEALQEDEGPFYYMDDDKKMELEYYKNSIIHFFIPHAFLAVSLLTGREEEKPLETIISDYAFLKHLFQNEFVFDQEEDLGEKVPSLIEYFLDPPLLSRSEFGGGYKITKFGFDRLPIWAALVKTYLESYWIAVKTVGHQRLKGAKKADLLKEMNGLGRRYHKLQVIEHIGALSQFNFVNALGYVNGDILKTKGDSEEVPDQALERLGRLGHRLYELSHYGQ
jgi:glycerol-3-phosphate O-acyltransferase